MTQWQLRYRSPLAPTKGVDDVIIETDSDHEPDAHALAQWWLATHMASPATRFVFVRRLVVATSAEMKAAKKAPATTDADTSTGPDPVQAASRGAQPEATADSDEHRTSRRGAPAAGRVGA
jgi:hypothetical protein